MAAAMFTSPPAHHQVEEPASRRARAIGTAGSLRPILHPNLPKDGVNPVRMTTLNTKMALAITGARRPRIWTKVWTATSTSDDCKIFPTVIRSTSLQAKPPGFSIQPRTFFHKLQRKLRSVSKSKGLGRRSLASWTSLQE
jgi:hypothetical protein